MQAKITIQELEEHDDYISYAMILKQLTSLDLSSLTKEAYIKHLKLIKSNPLHKIFIVKVDNIMAGTVTLLIEPKFIHNLSYVGHIEDVVVDKNYRSYGLGRILVEYAINVAKEYSCYKILLDCNNGNTGFYNKFGFKIKDNNMALYISENSSTSKY